MVDRGRIERGEGRGGERVVWGEGTIEENANIRLYNPMMRYYASVQV